MSNEREFFHDYFEIAYAQYPVKIIYVDTPDNDDVDVMSCEIDLDGGVKVKVDDNCLDALKPELIKHLEQQYNDELVSMDVA